MCLDSCCNPTGSIEEYERPCTCTLTFAILLPILLTHPAAAQFVNENLLVQPPPGYRTDFQTTKGNMQMVEWVPASETVDNWTEMVTVQIFHGLKTTPEQFKANIEEGLARGLSRRQRLSGRAGERARLSGADVGARL